MYYSVILYLFLPLFLMQLSVSASEMVIHPCVKRDKQIYCAKSSNLYRASRSNSSIVQGPLMYSRRYRVPSTIGTTSTTTISPAGGSQSKTHVMYYTKQYDQKWTGGQNAFDLNDADEHAFMHQTGIEENVIDDGFQQRIIKRGRIDAFIEENKALIRRMVGDHSDVDWLHPDTRQQFSSFHDGPNRKRPKRAIGSTSIFTDKVDSCQSSVEIVTPYWASNSGGKIRAIVNTQHLQQAIQQELCQAVTTSHCHKGCTCEQKYMMHRLLAYDPDDECKGIFMDWFLFPSGCVCRCTKY